MRSCDATPLGETFRDARVRAMVLALLVKSPSGGCVESVVTFATQRLFLLVGFFGDGIGPSFPGAAFPRPNCTVRARAWA